MGGKLGKVKPYKELLYLSVNCFFSFTYTAILGPNSMQGSEVILLDSYKPQGNPLLRE